MWTRRGHRMVTLGRAIAVGRSTMWNDPPVPIPDFQTLMRPLLEEVSSQDERPIGEVRADLARRFDLTEEELAERLPSGLAKTFDNRVGWAATYLYRCGLLNRPRRSVYAVTDRGRRVLDEHPDRVDLSVLAQFPEFERFRSGTGRRRRAVQPAPPVEVVATPEERVEAGYQELREALVAELRERIFEMPWAAFEELVLDVLEAMGYGDEGEGARLRTGGGGADSGIDGLIREDRLGLDVVYVQAKRWGSLPVTVQAGARSRRLAEVLVRLAQEERTR